MDLAVIIKGDDWEQEHWTCHQSGEEEKQKTEYCEMSVVPQKIKHEITV